MTPTWLVIAGLVLIGGLGVWFVVRQWGVPGGGAGGQWKPPVAPPTPPPVEPPTSPGPKNPL